MWGKGWGLGSAFVEGELQYVLGTGVSMTEELLLLHETTQGCG